MNRTIEGNAPWRRQQKDVAATNPLLAKVLGRLHRIQLLFFWLTKLSNLLLILIFGIAILGLWSYIRPNELMEQLLISISTLILAAYSFDYKKMKLIDLDELVLSLEIAHPETPYPAMDLRHPARYGNALPHWLPHLENHIDDVSKASFSKFRIQISSLIIPLAIAAFSWKIGQPSFRAVFSNVRDAVTHIRKEATLIVVEGTPDHIPSSPIGLKSGKISEVSVLIPNLIKLEMSVERGTGVPLVELHQGSQNLDPSLENSRKKPFQSFQMIETQQSVESSSSRYATYSIEFAASETVDIHVPMISSKQPVAHINVKELPVPKVFLTSAPTNEDPWPDDRPLDLRIEVKAENPIQLVQLIITSGKKAQKELVNRVVATDLHELRTNYSLILEPYVQDDIETIEVIAEAIDRGLPEPLIGRSTPISLRVASAYGRYRETLTTLNSLKEHVDKFVENPKKSPLSQDSKKLASTAERQSENSPFFDGADRVIIAQIDAAITQLVQSPDFMRASELRQVLNDFLYEHEILDERERDRDFFVAIRSLSRLIEQNPSERLADVNEVIDRLNTFLDQRTEHWKKRVDRLPEADRPVSYRHILTDRPFHGNLRRIRDALNDHKENAVNFGLETLSATVVTYRQWIEELEKKEDSSRQQRDQQRQEGLASARNLIKELQKRQEEISRSLDHASDRPKNTLEESWPAVRMQQNANIKDTGRLESMLRILSPTAGDRIKVAGESMSQTLETGNQGEFSRSESYSDLAGRLLRQADSAAEKSQNQQRSRGRRRRVAGDNYYGQAVVSGDLEIKREYEVDRRYRDKILDEVRGSDLRDDNRAVLEDYLREVIR